MGDVDILVIQTQNEEINEEEPLIPIEVKKTTRCECFDTSFFNFLSVLFIILAVVMFPVGIFLSMAYEWGVIVFFASFLGFVLLGSVAMCISASIETQMKSHY